MKIPKEYIHQLTSQLNLKDYEHEIDLLRFFGLEAIEYALTIVATAHWRVWYINLSKDHLVLPIPQFLVQAGHG